VAEIPGGRVGAGRYRAGILALFSMMAASVVSALLVRRKLERLIEMLAYWDDLDLTAQYKDQIAAFAAKDRAERPWAVPAQS